MGVSYAEHQAKRAQPWPRYRVGWWVAHLQSHSEEPRLYYTYKAALAQAEAHASHGRTVRVCVLHQSGTKQDFTLEQFRHLSD